MRRVAGLLCISIALAPAPDGHTQSVAARGVAVQRNLSVAAAKVIAEAALAECAARGFKTAVVVLDRAGLVLAVLRDERAPPITFDMARGKAYTALSFGTSTLEFQKGVANDPTRAPLRDVPGVLALGGGVPIVVEGETIGAAASSGSSQTTDDECARAGVAKAEPLLSPQ